MAGGVYTGGGATVVMDPPPIVYVNVFRSGSAPERHLRRKAQAVAHLASKNAPVKTGHLSSSIRVDQNRAELGRFAFGFKVYTNVRYAHYVHEGTGPSVRWRGVTSMKFFGTNQHAGDYVFPDVVFHPGISAQPFLQKSLVAMVGP